MCRSSLNLMYKTAATKLPTHGRTVIFYILLSSRSNPSKRLKPTTTGFYRQVFIAVSSKSLIYLSQQMHISSCLSDICQKLQWPAVLWNDWYLRLVFKRLTSSLGASGLEAEHHRQRMEVIRVWLMHCCFFFFFLGFADNNNNLSSHIWNQTGSISSSL